MIRHSPSRFTVVLAVLHNDAADHEHNVQPLRKTLSSLPLVDPPLLFASAMRYILFILSFLLPLLAVAQVSLTPASRFSWSVI